MVLGLFKEAWETLEDLPAESKNYPHVLALRVRILAHEKEWLKLTFLAEGVLSAFPSLAGVWYDLSKARIQLGELEAAKAALKRACELDQELKLKALDDFEFTAIW